MIGNRREGTLQFGYEKFDGKLSSCWKLLTAPFIFGSAGEMLIGLTLVYLFRCFERFYGSQKYSIFAVYSFIVPILFNLLLSSVLSTVLGVHNIKYYWKSGPYGLIFSSLVIYYVMIPATVTYSFSQSISYKFTEKHVVYLLALQLLTLNFWRALPISMCGLLTGIIYANSSVLRNLKPPATIAEWFGRNIYPLVNSANLSSRQNRLDHQQAISDLPRMMRPRRNTDQGFADNLLGGRQDATNLASQLFPQSLLQNITRQQRQPQQNRVAASEENIQVLVNMGFDRADVINALNATNNNMEEATEMLLAGN